MNKNTYQLDRAKIYLAETQKAIEFLTNNDRLLADLVIRNLQKSCSSELKNQQMSDPDYQILLEKISQIFSQGIDQIKQLEQVRTACHQFILK
ncbi:MAG: hypothetical protein ABF804_10540 [Liquorilactobacillus ghanensis]|jgi:hypothetical protein|uniref:Uncharacterized protein n=1 Tax=Liquorilactobacillus ghanensis DSM 18630 TaxID=1423750 RepID=A0A0R1VGM8_9LACO|nr:hypothetical protein [Liquorilactobacillus ghanensis]KRM04399.1 hypothetical protein FC89_GL002343 [Liquorilactobacillus ghanensis DSM 18630]